MQTQSYFPAGSLTPTEVSKVQTLVDNGMLGQVLVGKLIGANFNVSTDNAIPINSSKYIIRRIMVTNASISLTTAVGGVYTAISKGGTTLVINSQIYSALTATTKFIDLTLQSGATSSVLTGTTIYLSLTTPQGAAATADVYVFADKLD